MSLFHREQTYLGVDFGSGSIKAVEMANKGHKPMLVTYGLVETQRNIGRDQSPEGVAEATALLLDLKKRARVRAKRVVASIPDFSVFSAVLRLPAMPDKDLHQAIVWEAKKILPLPPEEVNIDWQVIGENSASDKPVQEGSKDSEAGKEMQNGEHDASDDEAREKNGEEDAPTKRVLITAAPKKIVRQYAEILKKAGLEIVSMETESFALIRSLVGYDPSTVLLVDIGAVVTHMVMVEKDVPVLTRSIDVGGNTITQAIAHVMGVNMNRAEQFKRAHGIPLYGQTAGSGVPKAITQTVAAIVQELRYLIDTHTRQNNGTIDKVIATGGSSLLPGLAAYLEEQLGLRVFVGDPFARSIYPLDVQSVLEEVGPRLAVAAGLAMWGITV